MLCDKASFHPSFRVPEGGPPPTSHPAEFIAAPLLFDSVLRSPQESLEFANVLLSKKYSLLYCGNLVPVRTRAPPYRVPDKGPKVTQIATQKVTQMATKFGVSSKGSLGGFGALGKSLGFQAHILSDEGPCSSQHSGGPS